MRPVNVSLALCYIKRKKVSLFFTKPVLNKSCRLFQLGLRNVLENNSYSPLKEKETANSTVLLKAQNLQKMYLKLVYICHTISTYSSLPRDLWNFTVNYEWRVGFGDEMERERKEITFPELLLWYIVKIIYYYCFNLLLSLWLCGSQ